MKNNVKNQGLTTTLSYIVIKIDYDNKLIMPVEDGMEFMRCWAGATQMKTPYDKPVELTEADKDFEIKFLSEQAFKELHVSAMIGSAPED